ncbi:MAG: PEP-CTERM sorting domain-containing protein [Planctomycetales bacterium]|nr:PEP-CTERM sorting domain-containing protein [Planctomycetales bacterium]
MTQHIRRLTSPSILLACLVGVLASSPIQVQGAEPNDDFANRTVLAPSVRVVSDDLEGVVGADLVLGFFTDNTYTTLIDSDDDSSSSGNGLASGLTGLSVNADGSIPLQVTGFDDFGFTGAHTEAGEYDVLVDVYDGFGGLITSFTDTGILSIGVVDSYLYSDVAWIGGTFDVNLDNLVGVGPDPLDFYTFTGLTPGALFTAEITAGDFDTELGWFDDSGALLSVDDDSGVGTLSLITGVVPASGQLVFAVTGYPDDLLTGAHAENGAYTLTVTVPEPASLSLLASLAIGGMLYRRPRAS